MVFCDDLRPHKFFQAQLQDSKSTACPVCLKRVSAPKNPPRDQEEPPPGPGAIFLLPERKSQLLSQVESSSLWMGKNMGRYFVGSTLNFPPLGK